MRKILLGLVATAAIASPLALSVSAEAVTTTSTDPACVPVTEKAAVPGIPDIPEVPAKPAVTHDEYKYKPVVNGSGPTHWSLDSAPANITVGGVAYKLDLNNNGSLKTQTIIDIPAVPAVPAVPGTPGTPGVDGVTCQIPFPANPLTGLNGISPNMTVPTPAGTEKYTFSPVVNHIALNGKIGTTATTEPGYVFPNGATSKVFAATPDNSLFLFYSDLTGRHINLPDVFDVKQDFDGVTYWSTQVKVTVVNDTATAREFRIRYADQQDGNRVWVERAIFTDGQPGTVIEPGTSRVMTFDVWYDVPSESSDVPNDLTLDFGFELA